MTQLVYLIPLFPLIGFLLNGLFWKSMPKKLAGIIGSVAILASFCVALGIFFEVKSGGVPDKGIVHIFNFISVGKFSVPFAFLVDQLSAMFLLIITGIGFLIHLYSTAYMHDDAGYTKYFAYLNLFVFFMLLLVLGANYVVMFIGWEGVGLASYLLIGFWYKNKEYTNASKKAFIMNRIGDLGFLVGLMLTIYNFGTASYHEFFGQLSGGIGTMTDTGYMIGTGMTNAIAICFFIGAMGKSAQIPLYTWLPDAMAGPTPVSALIHAATMVTAGIYMIARSNALFNLAPMAQNMIAIIGLATVLLAASIAIKQNDIKKVLAYSTVSQLGYMFLALGVGAYVGSLFHVMTHAFFKALLFLGSGSVIHAMSGEQDMRKMGGLGKHMPITKFTFLIGCLAIAGLPGFSGFFSKDEILAAAYAKNPMYYYFALLGALMTAYYMFRAYFYTFSGSFRGTEAQKHHLHESPAAMTIPLIILAVLSVIGGYVGLPEVIGEHLNVGHLLNEYLSPVVQNFDVHHLSHSTEWTLMAVATALIVIMIIIAKAVTKKEQFKEATGLAKVLENKWYIDEVYDFLIVKPMAWIAKILNNVIELKGIDAGVNGVGQLVQWGSTRLKNLQSGQVGSYLFAMVIGIIIIFAIGIFGLFYA
ncbi:NADH-quinone oxidoreductase subunit L [Taibaiella sp. KBW10]|uniref:NADH-quinone oxidoreductase subunit L n=1 Tax=Taibaiella sp. KBW10 TaxID=2153357 RepID=UPI000F5A0C36|nr:NADH-quinone oxidoreductase subunit L [Taibaiella sp. KBW10]RQO31682.1 NADH-quinone oxidoreductase subunit L [Taibaiella sp. KBW10]